MSVSNAIIKPLSALVIILMSSFGLFAQELPELPDAEVGVPSELDSNIPVGGVLDIVSSLLEDISGPAIHDDNALGGTSPQDLPADVGVPVDGGLSLLLAAGAAYGIRRLRKKSINHGVRTSKG
jgi:hypothetical protein